MAAEVTVGRKARPRSDRRPLSPSRAPLKHPPHLAQRICNFLYLCVIYIELPMFARFRRWLADRMMNRTHRGLFIGSNVVLADYRSLVLGDHVAINRGCHLSSGGGLTIGDHVAIGHDTSILTTEHGYSDRSIPIADQPALFGPVEIGSNVWIGARVCILAGVTIAPGTVIAAGSVVSKSVTEADTIIGGVPARRLKSRFD